LRATRAKTPNEALEWTLGQSTAAAAGGFFFAFARGFARVLSAARSAASCAPCCRVRAPIPGINPGGGMPESACRGKRPAGAYPPPRAIFARFGAIAMFLHARDVPSIPGSSETSIHLFHEEEFLDELGRPLRPPCPAFATGFTRPGGE